MRSTFKGRIEKLAADELDARILNCETTADAARRARERVVAACETGVLPRMVAVAMSEAARAAYVKGRLETDRFECAVREWAVDLAMAEEAEDEGSEPKGG